MARTGRAPPTRSIPTERPWLLRVSPSRSGQGLSLHATSSGRYRPLVRVSSSSDAPHTEWMQLYPRPGVYELRHTPSGKCYIGYSTSVRSMIRKHFRRLRLGKHGNRLLQSLYSSSPDDWVAIVLEYEPKNSAEAEARWIARRGDSALNIIRVPWSIDSNGPVLTHDDRARLSKTQRLRYDESDADYRKRRVAIVVKGWATRRKNLGLEPTPGSPRDDETREQARISQRRRRDKRYS